MGCFVLFWKTIIHFSLPQNIRHLFVLFNMAPLSCVFSLEYFQHEQELLSSSFHAPTDAVVQLLIQGT